VKHRFITWPEMIERMQAGESLRDLMWNNTLAMDEMKELNERIARTIERIKKGTKQ
jgi:hypothetical protein